MIKIFVFGCLLSFMFIRTKFDDYSSSVADCVVGLCRYDLANSSSSTVETPMCKLIFFYLLLLFGKCCHDAYFRVTSESRRIERIESKTKVMLGVVWKL